MKNKELFDAFRKIDVAYILDAAPGEYNKKMKNVSLKWATLVACLLILMIAVLPLLPDFIGNTVPGESSTESSAGKTEPTQSSNSETSTTFDASGKPPVKYAPAMAFSSPDELLLFLQTPSYERFQEEYILDYQSAVEAVYEIGHIYLPKHDVVEWSEKQSFLYPANENRVLAYNYYFTFEGDSYCIGISYIDPAYYDEEDLSSASDMYDAYQTKTYGKRYQKPDALLSHDLAYLDTLMLFLSSSDSPFRAVFFLDIDCQVSISCVNGTSPTTKDFLSLVKSFRFEYHEFEE